jgi:hypothetical protein
MPGYNVPELKGLELVLDYETIAAIYLGACQYASHTPAPSAFILQMQKKNSHSAVLATQ